MVNELLTEEKFNTLNKKQIAMMEKMMIDKFPSDLINEIKMNNNVSTHNDNMEVVTAFGTLSVEAIGKELRRAKSEDGKCMFVMTVDKSNIDNKDYKMISNQIKAFMHFGKDVFQSVLIVTSGYDGDSRELFEIEEVKSFYKEMYIKNPEWLYVINLEVMSSIVFPMIASEILIDKKDKEMIGFYVKFDEKEIEHIKDKVKRYGFIKLKDKRVLEIIDIIENKYNRNEV